MFRVNPCRGSKSAWHRIQDHREHRSSIDHILTYGCSPGLSHSVVDRQWDTSDHWPTYCRWRSDLAGVQLAPKKPVNDANDYARMATERIVQYRDTIVNHNRFAVLAALDDEDDDGTDSDTEEEKVDQLATQFVEASHEIAGSLGLPGDPAP